MRPGSFLVFILMAGGLVATSCGGGDEETAAPKQALTSTPAAAADPVLAATLTASPTATPTPPSTPTATPVVRSETQKKGVDRIAFVGPDGQIFTVDPDGSHPRRISPETGVFTWPTWSPDASKLVFSGVVEDEGGNIRISLLAFSTVSGSLRKLHVGEQGVAGILAEGVVHYPLWSPDSTRVAFIAFTSQGLSLEISRYVSFMQARRVRFALVT